MGEKNEEKKKKNTLKIPTCYFQKNLKYGKLESI